MTTAPFTKVTPSTELQRIGRVVRLHFANRTTITFPWIIFGAIFAASRTIWMILYFSAPGAADRRPRN